MPEEGHPFVTGKWQANLPPQGNEWLLKNLYFAYLPLSKIENVFLGSFPTYEAVNFVRRRGSKEFFYGSVDNNFWHILSALIGIQITTETNCFSLLKQFNYGITDILKKVNRNGKSSKDKDLTALEYNNIIDLFQEYPDIKNIFVTSGGKSPIGNATSNCVSKWLRDYLLSIGYNCTGFNTVGYKKQITIFQNGLQIKQLNLVTLITPSNQAWQSLQGCINRKNLSPILNLIPANMLGASVDNPFNRLRLLQWGYKLSSFNFPIQASLQQIINNNLELIRQIFS